MTVSSTTNRKTFAGNGVTTSFATSPVVFFDTSDLVLTVVTDSTGASETLVENTDYTVTGGAGSTGTVSLAGGSSPYGAPAAGTTVVIRRVLPLTQTDDFVNNDINDAEVLEDNLDRLVMVDQQQSEEVGRALKVPSSEGEQDDIAVAGKAGYYLRRNVAGTAFELAVGDINTSTFTQSGTGAVERSVTAKLGEVVSVKDFGAVGDGTTDDTAAIQAAIDTGKSLYIPSGTYVISSTLNLITSANHGQIIRGAGPVSLGGVGTGKTIIKPTAAVSKVWYANGSGFPALFLQYCGFEDMTIDMANMTDAATSMGWNQANAWGFRYTNCTVINDGTLKRGIVFNAGAYVSTVNGGYFKRIELTGISDANAVTTISFIDVDTTQYIMNFATAINVIGGAIQGTVDKFVGYANGVSGALGGMHHVIGLTVTGLDIEGASGIYMTFGSTCRAIYSRANLSFGFSGTPYSGTPIVPYELCDQTETAASAYPVLRTCGEIYLNNQNVNAVSSLLSGGAAKYYLLGFGTTANKMFVGASGGAVIGPDAAGDGLIYSPSATNIWLGHTGVAKGQITTYGYQAYQSRTQNAIATSTASANDLTLPNDGNFIRLTGNTGLNRIDTTGWQGGAQITLMFIGSVTVSNNTANSGAFQGIILNGGVAFNAVNSNTLTLVWDSIDGFWIEVSRKV